MKWLEAVEELIVRVSHASHTQHAPGGLEKRLAAIEGTLKKALESKTPIAATSPATTWASVAGSMRLSDASPASRNLP